MAKHNLFGIEEEQNENYKKYTTKVEAPQYLPKNKCPSIYDLVDTRKYNSLVNEINQADITPEQKEFLIRAATRHLVFRYDRIADYYAHQDKTMQELMEKSALVIIDYDDAIANGYVKLNKELIDIAMKQSNISDIWDGDIND